MDVDATPDPEEEEEESSDDSDDVQREYDRMKREEAVQQQLEIQERLKAALKAKTVKMKDHILVLDKSKSLPPELPANLIYWHRCETRVCTEDVVTNEHLLDFYQTEFMHHEDLTGEVAKVSDEPSFFRDKPIFIDETI